MFLFQAEDLESHYRAFSGIFWKINGESFHSTQRSLRAQSNCAFLASQKLRLFREKILLLFLCLTFSHLRTLLREILAKANPVLFIFLKVIY